MPIFIALFVLAGVIYGAVHAYDALAERFGVGVAIGAAVVAALVVIGEGAWWWRRRREIAPNIHDGDWTHELKESWGGVRLAAGKGLCTIRLGSAQGDYIFGDLQRAQAERDGSGWRVGLAVKDTARPVWQLPMQSERQARQWQRILTLAIAQKL
ncbi:hypothetical protein [Paraburkholderia rhizosphaerae]|uniref:Uncharacterized protein n=1 Tax=Paraburkholderia rhizosphaerae TaxID=480658 RepID=A0A4R8LKE3_9BURK|nr:hypothetical protein [Paraburkholderia rhizosphaerae]TDY42991.1 hypothetical protein BX592_119109 [Paraburkholderia rhizosphaerae]